jgi:hypothetical protein
MGHANSIFSWGTMLQAARSRVRFAMSLDFSVYLILPAELWIFGRLSLWQKWVPGIFLGVKSGRRVRLTTSLPSADCPENVGVSTSHNSMSLHGLLRDSFTITLQQPKFNNLKSTISYSHVVRWESTDVSEELHGLALQKTVLHGRRCENVHSNIQ